MAAQVTSAEFQERLQARAASAELMIPAQLLPPLEAYYRLLARWNDRVNLTALELTPLSDAAVDRLFIEPLLAARCLPRLPRLTWLDVGSGGGSPALPLLLAVPTLRLTMIESRERKAAFLREAARTLELSATVEARRFEDMALSEKEKAGLITARAVRVDGQFLAAASRLLCADGVVALFGVGVIDSKLLSDTRLASARPIELSPASGHRLTLVRHVPRGTELG